MKQKVFRQEFRACLNTDDQGMIRNAVERCRDLAEELRAAERMMTVGLYYHGRQLFLYYEALGEAYGPETFMSPLDDLLMPWPEKGEPVLWAPMYPIYWHQVPEDSEDWIRPHAPERRIGRIAYLNHDLMFEYVYHHFAIVREGIFKGDRYQFISLHEDVLFSYFEEPRTNVNIRRTEEGDSEAIRDWMAVNPPSHFDTIPGTNGGFLILPDYFNLG